MYSNYPNKKILYKELSYKLNGLLFKTHKELGRFCRERQYADFFESLLKDNNLSYKKEFEITKFNSISPKGNRVDFFIENAIIVDFKAKSFITTEDYIQMQRYLQSSNIELGIIVNFRTKYLKPKRVLNYSLYKHKDSEHSYVNSDNSD